MPRAALSLLAALVFVPVNVHAASGDLDPTFGVNGVALGSFGGSFGFSVARQTDGKLVVAGRTDTGTGIAVARYDASGAPDATFGVNGQAITDVGPLQDVAVRVLVQPDGKIVAVGTSDVVNDGSDVEVVLVRYDAGGMHDGTFGTLGVVRTSLGTGTDFVQDAALQADGGIVVVGGGRSTDTVSDAFVLRFTSTGALDGTFGSGGLVTLDFGGRNDQATGVVVQPDQNIVVATTSFNGPLFVDGGVAALTRLDPTGTPDPTFGTGGSVVYAPDTINVFHGVLRQPDGKLVVLGGSGLKLIRYDSAGVEDAMFSGDPVPFFMQNPSANGFALAPDGKFVVVGDQFRVARFDSDGSIDGSFGIGGWIQVAVGVGGSVAATLVEPSGDIVVAGGTRASARRPFEMALARLSGTSAPCTTDADCGVCERCGGSTCEIGQRSACAAAGPDAARITILHVGFRRALVKLAASGTVPAFDPTTTDDMGVCAYQNGRRILKLVAPAGGLCAGVPCWTGTFASGLEYDDPDATPDGIRRAQVSGTGVKLLAKGQELMTSAQGVPDTLTLGPLGPPLLVQVHAGNGTCSESTYDSARKISPTRFLGRSE